jgi:putative peptidoglycan lipid II flippase
LSGESDLGRSTLTSMLVMGCTLLSRMLGFVRLIFFTTFFSAASADVINLAFSIPNNLRKLLAEGALSSAFIPVLSESLVRAPDGSEARPLVSSIINFQILIIAPICILGVIFSDSVVRLLADFDNPEQIEAASRLFKLVVNYLLLISVSAVLMGVLNAHRKFVVPAIAPILFSVAVILAITFLRGTFDVYAMALGVLCGGAAQIAVQYPLFHRLGYRFRFRTYFGNTEFKKIMVRWLPILATSSVFVVTQQIAIKFASGIEEGSITAVSIALTFFQLPFGIFSASITNVLFPRMSSQAARKDFSGLVDSMRYGIRFLTAVLVPSGVFLCLMATQLISVGFLKGEFSMANVLLASPVLVYYSVGLLSVGMFTFLQRAFYSLGEYRVPFAIAVVVATVDIILSLWLKETRLRTGGIALANSIAFSLGTVLLLAVMRKRLGPLGGRKILITAIKVALSSTSAAAALLLFNRYIGHWWEAGRTVTGFLLIFAAAGIFSVIILGAFKISRVEMLDVLKTRIRRQS